MGRTCRGICELYRAKPSSNKTRYQIGQKRCTFCAVFFSSADIRCICCKAVLRTRPRSRKNKDGRASYTERYAALQKAG